MEQFAKVGEVTSARFCYYYGRLELERRIKTARTASNYLSVNICDLINQSCMFIRFSMHVAQIEYVVKHCRIHVGTGLWLTYAREGKFHKS